MNDRYLFRGKRADNGGWVIGLFSIRNFAGREYYAIEQREKRLLSRISCDSQWTMQPYEVILGTVGQCTGLKDKNGKLIFEGDICEYGDSVGVIRYYNDDAMYSFVYDENDTINFDCMWGNALEIIGNIHDRPELLEVKE